MKEAFCCIGCVKCRGKPYFPDGRRVFRGDLSAAIRNRRRECFRAACGVWQPSLHCGDGSAVAAGRDVPGRVAVGRYPRSRLLQSGFIFLTSAATSLRVTFWFSGFPSLSSLTSATFSRSSADSFSSFFIACIFLIRVLSFPVQVSNTCQRSAGRGRKRVWTSGLFDPSLRRHNENRTFCNPHRRAEVPDKMAGRTNRLIRHFSLGRCGGRLANRNVAV